MLSARKNPLTFQELILTLQKFWAEQGTILQQPYDVEVGAGTMSPETFLRVLGPKPYKVAYLQPSRRPADGRYGDNPNRLFKHTQLQVILKPPPADIQDLYLQSLQAIGIDLRKHDLKFEEDNWESPTLGAWGIGWQVMLDGLEITQFTYFQQCGGLDLDPVSVELTYGLERLCAFLQDVDSVYEIAWTRDVKSGRVTTYGDVRHAEELQFSVYNFERADVEKTWEHLKLYEAECKALVGSVPFIYERTPSSILLKWDDHPGWNIRAGNYLAKDLKPSGKYQVISFVTEQQTVLLRLLPIRDDFESESSALIQTARSGSGGGGGTMTVAGSLPLPALDLCLKCSHLFNILDARGAISVTERVGVIARIRALAVGIAKAYADQQSAESSTEQQSAVVKA
jgi:glycyl-tRNA synthetase alpha chain